EVDRLPGGFGAGGRRREQEQALDERDELGGARADASERDRIGRVRFGEQLELSGDGGQRRLQLVRRVEREALRVGERGPEAIDQVGGRRAQRLDLGVLGGRRERGRARRVGVD